MRGREAAGLRGLDDDDKGPLPPPSLTEGDDDASPGCLEKKPRRVDCFLELVDEGGADDLAIVRKKGKGGRMKMEDELDARAESGEVASRDRSSGRVVFFCPTKQSCSQRESRPCSRE